MTQQEIENELKSLRELEEARKKNFRSIRKAALIVAVQYLLLGGGLLVFSVFYTGSRPETLQTGIMFFGWSVLFLSFPLSLLAGALRRKSPFDLADGKPATRIRIEPPSKALHPSLPLAIRVSQRNIW